MGNLKDFLRRILPAALAAPDRPLGPAVAGLPDLDCTTPLLTADLSTRHYSPSEAGRKIRSFSTDTWLTIADCAEKEARAINLLEGDGYLVGEAIKRIMLGKRRWPRNLSAEQYFCGPNGVLHSIATSLAKGYHARNIEPLGDEHDQASGDANPLEILEDLQRSGFVLKLFSDDLVAQEIIIMLQFGHSFQQIRHELGLDQTRFDSKLRKIKRRAAAARNKV